MSHFKICIAVEKEKGGESDLAALSLIVVFILPI